MAVRFARIEKRFFPSLCLLALAACSASDVGNTGGTAGTNTGSSGSTSTAGAAGTPATAGTGNVPTTAGTGGMSSAAGMTSTGGSAGSVTAGAGGAGGAAGGQGGSAGGASGGMAGTTGGGSTTTPDPSMGCNKSGRPDGGKVTVQGEKIIDFPTSYDGKKPFPLLVALHACGNQNTQWENLTRGSAFETDYVRLMPNTSDGGQCWSNYANNIKRILQQYDDVLANYCIDKNRIFGVGHSSGAQMLVNTLSHKEDATHLNFKAVAPVAADPFNVAITIPVLYIDGQKDNQRSATSAADTMKKFRAANMCAETSKPYTPIMGCKSSDGPQVDPGCIIYDQCKAPTIWCAHNDPSYNNTQHGVPCFGVKSMVDFFKTF